MRRTDLLLARIIFRLHALENESENEKGPGANDVISEGGEGWPKGDQRKGGLKSQMTSFEHGPKGRLC